MRNVTKAPEEPLALRVGDFCARIGICKSSFWKFQAAGKIRTVRLGRRVVVPNTEVQRILREGFGGQ
jgi:hypothetical protein